MKQILLIEYHGFTFMHRVLICTVLIDGGDLIPIVLSFIRYGVLCCSNCCIILHGVSLPTICCCSVDASSVLFLIVTVHVQNN